MRILIALSLILCSIASELDADTNNLNANVGETPTPPTTSTPSPFSGLANLSCLTTEDFEQLFNGQLKFGMAYAPGSVLLDRTVGYIGMTELRKSLDLPPYVWTHHNKTTPSEEEIANAQTIEEYYELKFHRYTAYNLDNRHFYEHNFKAAAKVLDKQGPGLRQAFRQRFEDVRRLNDGVVDRKTVDRAIAEYDAIREPLKDEMKEQMLDWPSCDIL